MKEYLIGPVLLTSWYSPWLTWIAYISIDMDPNGGYEKLVVVALVIFVTSVVGLIRLRKYIEPRRGGA